jgi:hypothetical protein
MRTAPARRAARALLVVVLFALGCYTSSNPNRFAPAIGPHGVMGELAIAKKRVRVELLELGDSSYVVLAGNRVAVVPFSAVSAWRFAQIADWRFGPPAPYLLEQLRSASRFPFGMPPAALAELLSAAGQQAPDDLSSLQSR